MSLLRQAEACLKNQQTYKALNAFIARPRDADALLQAARAADVRHERKAGLSPIDGNLIAIKDNICTVDSTTTCASRILNDYTSPFPATVVERLRDAGAIAAGKTNLDEFGMGSHSQYSYFGSVKNLKQLAESAEVSPGGSSGGSAVAVATGQCQSAIGTDTGGSVRLPAAYTGIVGYKPSYGLVSRWGVVAYANSLDTVGVLAGDSTSAKAVFDAISGYDEKDPTSLSGASRSRIADAVRKRTRNASLRIGVPHQYNISELSSPVRQAWLLTLDFLKAQGHTIHPVSLPTTRHALSAYYVLAPAEASSNLAKYDGIRYGTREDDPDIAGGVLYAATRGKGFGDEVKRRILLGAYSLSAEAMENYFIQAQKVRRLVQEDFDQVFALPHPLKAAPSTPQSDDDPHGVDILVCPTAPTAPPSLETVRDQAPTDAYMNDVLTVPASLAGLPALSVPVPLEEEGTERAGGPVGMQIIGQYGDDALVLEVGRMMDRWRFGG
ncbi:MAG: Trimeric GatFAB AmidoTransferase(AdT) complex subunit [Caeruleum heppii]|nr:MAG: Trimeric GatFAB AmidoTransferase(AdT) complex subunit [Caeruleum heppii]